MPREWLFGGGVNIWAFFIESVNTYCQVYFGEQKTMFTYAWAYLYGRYRFLVYLTKVFCVVNLRICR